MKGLTDGNREHKLLAPLNVRQKKGTNEWYLKDIYVAAPIATSSILLPASARLVGVRALSSPLQPVSMAGQYFIHSGGILRLFRELFRPSAGIGLVFPSAGDVLLFRLPAFGFSFLPFRA